MIGFRHLGCLRRKGRGTHISRPRKSSTSSETPVVPGALPHGRAAFNAEPNLADLLLVGSGAIVLCSLVHQARMRSSRRRPSIQRQARLARFHLISQSEIHSSMHMDRMSNNTLALLRTRPRERHRAMGRSQQAMLCLVRLQCSSKSRTTAIM